MSLRNRLTRLEDKYGKPCPECGLGGTDFNNATPSAYLCKWGETRKPEFCEACGQQTVIIIDLSKL
jgi:hypothetical protein